MAGVFQANVFQANVFQVGAAAPAPAPINYSRGIEAAFSAHTRPLQRKLPAHIQRAMLRQIERDKAEQRQRDRLVRLSGRALATGTAPTARRVDSAAGLVRRAPQVSR